MSMYDEHHIVSDPTAAELPHDEEYMIPASLNRFADELFFQVGLMRIVVGLVQEDMQHEFLPQDPEVLKDWQRNTTNLRYLAEPAFRYLTLKNERLSFSEDNSEDSAWGNFIRKNMTRLICFQEVMDSVAVSLEKASSFSEVKSEIIKPMRRAYIMCDEWQKRIIEDVYGEESNRSQYEIDLFQKICTGEINPWKWQFNQTATFNNLVSIQDLIQDLETKIDELKQTGFVEFNTKEISRPPLSICMATRRLFMAILQALGTSRTLLNNPELIERCHSLFSTAVEEISAIQQAHQTSNEISSLIIQSISALEQRLTLVDLFFEGKSTSTPQKVEKVAIVSDLQQLTEEERLLVPV